MTKAELTKLEAVLTACEFAKAVDSSGCPTCGWDTTMTCPLCGKDEPLGPHGDRHYPDCALWESLTAVRVALQRTDLHF